MLYIESKLGEMRHNKNIVIDNVDCVPGQFKIFK